MKLLNLIFGDPHKKILVELHQRVTEINALEPQIQVLTDEQLREKTKEFQSRLHGGAKTDELLPEAFAVAREAAHRTIGQRHYDVQLMGAIVLHRGGIPEMRTGEGKTLTAIPALYLNALEGKGAHLVTVNDYLARRDTVWMGLIFHALGLSVGCIQHEGGFLFDPHVKAEASPSEDHVEVDSETAVHAFRVDYDKLRQVSRAEAYRTDVTYGTNNEFGFDYLRDNMVLRAAECVQRDLHFVIVDEADSILIDEARTPLIISAPAEESTDLYKKFAQIADRLVEKEDYTVDEKLRAATLSEAGIAKVERSLGIENLYVEGGTQLVHHLEQALRAKALFKLDRDYVVKAGEVIIVDEFTGRLMQGRRYSEGLHQAIEAKEHVAIQRESETLATITFQNFFRMYKKLSGMTGTAATEAEEFGKIYKLDVITIPTHRENCRKDLPDRIYKTRAAKLQAVVGEIRKLQQAGQPVLVGTVSIERNEELHELLERSGIRHEILNAKNHEREAEIIAQAGRPGAVTLATNMAGRGVDIVLGGNPPESEQMQKTRELGGLFVIGTERHESRRIDNQLRGRSGRQGDPGATQFYVSLEDDLMRIFGSDRVKFAMEKLGLPEDHPIESPMVSKALEKAQQRVEGHHFDMRKHLLEYDDVLNRHRELIYGRRHEVLEAFDSGAPNVFREQVLEIVEDEVEQIFLAHGNGHDAGKISETLSAILPSVKLEGDAVAPGGDKAQSAVVRTEQTTQVMEQVKRAYDELEAALPDRGQLKEVERAVILRSMDRLWVDHLDAMHALRTGIGLRGYAQQDPLVAYKKEAFGMFNRLLGAINQEISFSFFRLADHALKAHQAVQVKSLLERSGIQLAGVSKEAGKSGMLSHPASEPPAEYKDVGRNDPCPCGSGKKYKKCHGV